VTDHEQWAWSHTSSTRCAEQLTIRWDHDVLWICGELDLASASTLEGAIESAIDSGRDEIVIDCSALTFIDASGLSVFLCAQRRSTENSAGKLIVRSPSQPARRLFDITGMSGVLNIVE
jgi:anti-anti-sigma factor